MQQTLVYDFPTRVFHWLFALLFIVAYSIGSTADDDSTIFSYHMIIGIILSVLVVLRIFWGVTGTKFARFSGFALHPKELALYFKGILSGDKRKWLGHNPASSWVAVFMMASALGLGVTGYLMITGQGGDDLEDVHELLANGFLVLAILHLAGLAIHALRHKDAMWESMLNGRKSDTPIESIPVPSHRALGIILLLVTIWFSTYLAQNFDSASRDITVFGLRFHLGEVEDDDHKSKSGVDRHKSRSIRVDHDNKNRD